jgi:hypothetical protein
VASPLRIIMLQISDAEVRHPDYTHGFPGIHYTLFKSLKALLPALE